jgi:hypothetical protein
MDEDRLLGRRGRVVRGAALDGAKRECRSTASGSAAVARLVRDDSKEPGLEGRSFPKPRQGVEGLDEAFLDSVLRVVRSAHQIRGTMGKVLVGAH